MGRTKQKADRRYQNDAVLVKATEGCTYAEMVTNLKKEFKAEDKLSDEIRALRQTREGHMLVEIRKGSKETDNICQKIRSATHMETARRLVGEAKRAANIYGIDIDTKEVEVEEKLNEVLRSYKIDEKVEVKALRPMTGGRKAATIIGKLEHIARLIETGKVKIGFSLATIRERGESTKCNRCWNFGHTARQCSGIDRTLQCRNCTKEGHKVQDCTNKPFCADCKQEGHRTASGRCSSSFSQK